MADPQEGIGPEETEPAPTPGDAGPAPAAGEAQTDTDAPSDAESPVAPMTPPNSGNGPSTSGQDPVTGSLSGAATKLAEALKASKAPALFSVGSESAGISLMAPPAVGVSVAFSAPAVAVSTASVRVQTAPAPVTFKSIITDILSWVGLGNLANSLPVPAVPMGGLVESLWLVVRSTQDRFNNQRPAANPTISTGQDPTTGEITGNLNLSDLDGDGLTVAVSVRPSVGSVVLDDDGTFTYNPDGALAATGGTVSFTVTIDDSIGNPTHYHGLAGLLGMTEDPVTATVTLTVDPYGSDLNAPVAMDDQASTDEDQHLTLVDADLLANDSDLDAGQTLTISGVASGANGTATFDGTTITYTPNPDFNGEDSFTYTLSDGSLTDTGTVHVTVNPVNDAPIAVNDNYTVAEDQLLIVGGPGVLSNDIDIDHTVGELNAVLAASPSYGTLTLNADGSFTYTPAANFNGEDSFTYHAFDGAALSTVATVSITVTAVNDTPSPAIDDIDADTGVVRGRIDVTDFDKKYTYSIAGPVAPSVGGVAIDPSTGTWTFTPSVAALVNAWSGGAQTIEFTITASDGETSLGLDISAPVGVSAEALTALLQLEGSRPSGVAVGPDGRIFVTNSGANTLTAINADSTRTTTVVGANPSAVAVDDQGRAWVVNSGDNTVSVVGYQSVIRNIAVGTTPSNIVFGSDGLAYVTVTGDNSVYVLDTASLSVQRSITVGDTPIGIAASDDGRLYVANFAGKSLTVIDTTENYATDVITFGDVNPYGVAVLADGVVVVSDPVHNTVVTLTPVAGNGPETDSGKVTRTVANSTTSGTTVTSGSGLLTFDSLSFQIDGAPTAIAAGPDGTFYVTSSGSNAIRRVNPISGATTTVTVGANPADIAVASDGTVYVSNAGSNSISVVDGQMSRIEIPVGTQIYQQTGTTSNGDLILVSLVNGSTKIVYKTPSTMTNYGSVSFDAMGNDNDIAVGPDGTIYLDGQTYFGWGGGVYAYRPDGTYIGSGTTYYGLIENGDTSLSDSEMTVGADGKIYVLSNRLYVGEPTGTFDQYGQAVYTFTTPAFDVTDLKLLTVGADGRIYVTQNNNNVVVYSGADYSTLATISVDVLPYTYWYVSKSISTGANGLVYLTSSGYLDGGVVKSQITVIDPNDYSTRSGTLDDVMVTDVAVGADGRVFAVGSPGILVLNPDLSIDTTISVGGQGFGEIVFGTDGRLYAIGGASVIVLDPTTYELGSVTSTGWPTRIVAGGAGVYAIEWVYSGNYRNKLVVEIGPKDALTQPRSTTGILDVLGNLGQRATKALITGHNIFTTDPVVLGSTIAGLGNDLLEIADTIDNTPALRAAGLGTAVLSAVTAAEDLGNQLEGIANGDMGAFIKGLVDVGAIALAVASIAAAPQAGVLIAVADAVVTGLSALMPE